jgi:hypothetical protein
MVHGDTRTVADAGSGADTGADSGTESGTNWKEACDRLGQLVESLLAEHDRLQSDNRRLRASMAEARASRKGPGAGEELTQVRRQLEQERRQWKAQRQVIADRLEAILGKFQWLEAKQEAAAEAAAPADD